MNILNLIASLAEKEARLPGTTFLAPCLPGGSIRTRVAGMVYSFRREPADFEGWGIFMAESATAARLTEIADRAGIDAYLHLFPSFKLRLVSRLRGGSWLAYPANESDARQRLGRAEPVALHLVEGASAFDGVTARWDGAAWWFDAIDRAADPAIADWLRAALAAGVEPERLRVKDLTPEMRAAYTLCVSGVHDGRETGLERRLAHALERGGGRLRGHHDRGDLLLVEWIARDGSRHTTAVAKHDLTVISAGICLSNRDRDFDLQSLVGVIDRRPGWMR